MRGIIRLGYEDSVPINSTASPGQSKLLKRHRIPNLKVIKNREARVELHIAGLLRFQKRDVIKNDRKPINQSVVAGEPLRAARELSSALGRLRADQGVSNLGLGIILYAIFTRKLQLYTLHTQRLLRGALPHHSSLNAQ